MEPGNGAADAPFLGRGGRKRIGGWGEAWRRTRLRKEAKRYGDLSRGSKARPWAVGRGWWGRSTEFCPLVPTSRCMAGATSVGTPVAARTFSSWALCRPAKAERRERRRRSKIDIEKVQFWLLTLTEEVQPFLG
jgi:hypothetical protein